MARKNQQRALREAAERAAQQQEILAIADASTASPNLATTEPSPGDVGQTVAIVSTTIRPTPTAA